MTKSPSILGPVRMGLMALALAVLGFGWGPAKAQVDIDHTRVVGADKCAECHKTSAEVWKGTHHFSTFRTMHRKKKAEEISGRMGLDRIKTAALCQSCHYTTTGSGDAREAISGISCESCHGAAQDWIKRHSEYSGKKKETESEAEAAARWADSEAGGMIRPGNLYRWAKNCYSCHTVPQEDLVNTGGHPAGSKFELVSWSQGEVRHNLWWSKENRDATTERKRMMFVIGQAVELETAMRAVGKATKGAAYAKAMAKRANTAKKRMAAVAKKLKAEAPELVEMVKIAAGAKLKLNNDAELSAAADAIGKLAMAVAQKYDGTTFAAIDGFIPGKNKYHGSPAL